MRVAVYGWAKLSPYHDLLYEALGHVGVEHVRVHSYPRAGSRPFGVLRTLRAEGVDVFHLHWPIWGPSWDVAGLPYLRLAGSAYWLMGLATSRLPVVWTVHNVLPHERRTSADLTVARTLARICTAKIVHSSETIASMKELGISTRNVYEIPHGTYADGYPPPLEQHDARSKLGWPVNRRVVLFVGLIRPYKGIPQLIEAFTRLQRDDVDLVIAGKCQDDALGHTVALAARDARIRYVPGYLDTHEVATYLSAADIVCLPYERVTTSGSALLALAFGRAIVAPRLGSLRDIPQSLGFFYEPQDPGGLRSALDTGLREGKPGGFDHALDEYLARISWDSVAVATRDVFDAATRYGGRMPSRQTRRDGGR